MSTFRRSSLAGEARVRQQGLSLLEALVALSCISVGLLGFFSSHGFAAQTDRASSALTSASQLAMTLATSLETLAAEGYLDVSLEGCPRPADGVSALCVSLPPVNRAGTTDLELGPMILHPSYAYERVSLYQERITVRVRYPSPGAWCQDCTDETLLEGWKAVTLTSLRYCAPTP